MVSTSINTILADAIIVKLNKKMTKGMKQVNSNNYYFVSILLPINKIDEVNTICEITLGVNTESKKTDDYTLCFTVSIGTSKYDEKEDIYYKNFGSLLLKKTGDKCIPANQTHDYKQKISKWLTQKICHTQKLITCLRVSPQRDCLTINYEEENILWEAKKKFCKEIEKITTKKPYASVPATAAAAAAAAASTSSMPYEIEARVKPSFRDCCVCLEETTNTTQCNHYICIVCLSRLHKQKCPLCRSILYPYQDDDEEDSSSSSSSEEASEAEASEAEEAEESEADASEADAEDAAAAAAAASEAEAAAADASLFHLGTNL